MEIALHYLIVVYFSLLFLQHLIIPRINAVAKKKQTLLILSQVFLVFYCVWIGASKNSTYEVSGLIMLVASVILFSWRLRRLLISENN